MSFQTEYQDVLYYGQYGGCFISDAFTISCDRLYEDYMSIADSAGFAADCRALAEKYAKLDFQVSVKAVHGESLLWHELCFNPYAVAGHALMAQRTGRDKALFGPRHGEEAVFCAAVCRELGLGVKMHLPTSLRAVESLTGWLADMGVELETKLCEIFDMPEMYAFQEWVAQPEESYCIYSRSNVGAFPATLMTTAFNQIYGNRLQERLENVGTIAVPCVSGSTALSIMKPWLDSSVRLCTMELEDGLTEELDSFCGAFTKVMRDNLRDRIIAPELACLWDGGRVERIVVERKEAIGECEAAMARGVGLLSLESAAALSAARGMGENVFVAGGAPRMGAML